jgi:NAD(P)H dehydrogenase (quinone)
MSNILIAYYSGTGQTEKLAHAVAEGVKEEKGTPDIKKVEDIDIKTLVKYDGIIIGSPVYFGSMASEVKKMIDKSVAIRPKLEGKVGAAFVTSRHRTGGKETTLLSILQAMLIHGMIVVGDPIESGGGHYGAAGADEIGEREAIALGKKVTKLADKLR